jgi:hypothetical protein
VVCEEVTRVEARPLTAPVRSDWYTVPEEALAAWTALRLTKLAGRIIDTHVPDGPLVDVVLDGFVPVFVYPVLHCRACKDGPLWICGPLRWARDWVEQLEEVVDAVERRSRILAGVSTPVVVGDVEVPAATWDTESSRKGR